MRDPFNNFNRGLSGYRPGVLTRIKGKLRRTFERIRFSGYRGLPRPQLPKLRIPRFTLPGRLVKKLWQSGISLLVFILVIGIFQLEYQWAQGIQGQIRSTLSGERDYSAQVKDYFTMGWWMNSYDRMVFTNHNRQEAVPVTNVAPSPMSVPVSGQVVKRFGLVQTEDGQEQFYQGIAIQTSQGSPIVAVEKGKVVRVTEDPILGRLVQLDHGEGVYSLYGYCSEILVREGQEVAKNQVIAKVGQTGAAQEPSLHFELREQGQLVDPLTRLQPSSSGI